MPTGGGGTRVQYEAETMRDFLGDPNIGGSIDSFPVACHRKVGKKPRRVGLFKMNPHDHGAEALRCDHCRAAFCGE